MLDFLVIVAGIMVSFLLNEWRQDEQDQRTEHRLLTSLRADLKADSLSLRSEIAELERITERGALLLDIERTPDDLDSIAILLSACASYTTFPVNDLTYREISTTGRAELIQDPELLRNIIELYERHWEVLREYQSIDKWLVLERFFPYLEAHISLADPKADAFNAMREDPQWTNLLYNSIGFKTQLKGILEEQAARIDSLALQVDAELVQ